MVLALAIAVIVLIVMPLIELYLIVLVGQAIGAWNTIGILILVAVVGVWLTKHEGFSVLQRMRQQRDAGRMPTDELIDGCLILLGGVLLILPGFISDAFGLVVLFPPTRALIRNLLKRHFRIVTIRRYNGRPYDGDPYDDGRNGPSSPPPVIDV